jgi:hypothetical protein
MAKQDGSSKFSFAGELFSIAHNSLPAVTTERRRGSMDVGLVCLYHIHPNLFDAAWYGEVRGSRGIRAGVVRLMTVLKVVSRRLSARATRAVVVTAWRGQRR